MGEDTTGAAERVGLDRLLRKNVTAVHSTGLSLLQRKIFNALLLAAYDDLLVKAEHEIPVEVLKILIDYKSKDLEVLRGALREIRGKPVEFNLLDRSDRGTWTITGLLSEASLGQGRCTFSFGKRMAEMLYRPEVYVLLNLRIQNKLQSSWTLNLYENISRFRDVQSTGWYDVGTWRKVLGATGEGFDEYKRFRARVLRPAVEEINEQSDLLVEMVEERLESRGKPISRIKFLIKPNPQTTLAPFPVDAHDELRNLPIFRELRELNVPERIAIEAIASDPAKAERIAAVVRAGAKKGEIKNPGAYAARLISSDADLSAKQMEAAGIKDNSKKKAEPAGSPAPARQALSGEEAREALVRAFENDRRRRCMEQLEPDRRKELLEEWVSEIRADGRSFLIKGCRVDRGELNPIALNAFERHVVTVELGKYDASEVDRWALKQSTRGSRDDG